MLSSRLCLVLTGTRNLCIDKFGYHTSGRCALLGWQRWLKETLFGVKKTKRRWQWSSNTGKAATEGVRPAIF